MYGLFNDEGLVEGGFATREEATKAALESYSPEDDLNVLECCPDHEDYPRICCEACDSEAEQEELDEAEEDDACGIDWSEGESDDK